MSPSHQWYGVVPGWLPFYALIAVALVLFAQRAIFLLRLMLAGKPTETQAAVSRVAWERTVQVESVQAVEHSNWDSAPAGAKSVTST